MKVRRLVLPAIILIAGCHLIGGAGDYLIGAESQGGAGTGAGGAAKDGGAGSGGCSASAEICLNGTDDDCDDVVDCDDSDCSDFSCQPVPSGGVWAFEVSGVDPCPDGFAGLELDDCGGCACDVVSEGTCTHVALHYDNHLCGGQPIEEVTIPAAGCMATTAVAANGETVGAIAEQVGLDDAQCDPQAVTAEIAFVALCTLVSMGTCTGGSACVPPAAGPACVLLDGAVTCPQPYLQRRLLHESSGARSCDCACDGGAQTCDPTKHYHAWTDAACSVTKFDVNAVAGCEDTLLTSVNSVDNHDQPMLAVSAECDNVSAPRTQTAPRTLCCVP